jgi:hypothetical protein
MRIPVNSPQNTEKALLRDEITEQIREYLQRGGEIEVVQDPRIERPPAVGSIWNDVADDIDIVGS